MTERPDGTERRRSERSMEALIIMLDDNMRRDQKEAHDRLRVSIDSISKQMGDFIARNEPKIRTVEDALLTIQTEKRLEDKQYAKQATFISIFVSTAISGVTQAVRSYFIGHP